MTFVISVLLWDISKERIDETVDPELTIDRALETYPYTREHF